jgi:hypothetical protein
VKTETKARIKRLAVIVEYKNINQTQQKRGLLGLWWGMILGERNGAFCADFLEC